MFLRSLPPHDISPTWPPCKQTPSSFPRLYCLCEPFRTLLSPTCRPGHGKPVLAALVEVEQGRLGVLSSTDAYLFHFKESRPSSPCGTSSSVVARLAGVDEAGDENDPELQMVYVWIGRDAGAEACAAARAQVSEGCFFVLGYPGGRESGYGGGELDGRGGVNVFDATSYSAYAGWALSLFPSLSLRYSRIRKLWHHYHARAAF